MVISTGVGTPDMLRLSVVVPMFNEAERIIKSIPSMSAWLRAQEWTSELLGVDDGSTDATARLADKLLCEATGASLVLTRLLQNESNRGKGAAVRHGFAESNGRWVLICDADESTPLSEASRLMTVAEETGAALTIGSRAVKGARVKALPHRVLFGRIFQKFTLMLRMPPVADSQCGFKLYDHTFAKRVALEGVEDGYLMDIEHLLMAERLGLRIAEVGVIWHHKKGSKVRLLRDGLAMAIGAVRLAKRFRPS